MSEWEDESERLNQELIDGLALKNAWGQMQPFDSGTINGRSVGFEDGVKWLSARILEKAREKAQPMWMSKDAEHFRFDGAVDLSTIESIIKELTE